MYISVMKNVGKFDCTNLRVAHFNYFQTIINWKLQAKYACIWILQMKMNKRHSDNWDKSKHNISPVNKMQIWGEMWAFTIQITLCTNELHGCSTLKMSKFRINYMVKMKFTEIWSFGQSTHHPHSSLKWKSRVLVMFDLQKNK